MTQFRTAAIMLFTLLTYAAASCRSTDKEGNPEPPRVTTSELDAKDRPKQKPVTSVPPPPTYPDAVKSPGCGKPTVGRGVEDLKLTVATQARAYLRVAPAQVTPGKPLALVFWWYGAASSVEKTRATPDFNHAPNLEALTANDAVWIHPRHIQGTNLTWERRDNGRDVQFFDQLYQQAIQDFCVDLRKVYTIGVSNGGTFANYLTSIRGDKIKGAVAVAIPAVGAAWRKVNVPSMLIQDDRDNFRSAQQTLAKMTQDSGCPLATNQQLTAQEPATCYLVPNCPKTTAVAFCPWKVKTGANPHDWPRFTGADQQIWRFLTTGSVN
ncbi:MAG: hypothetical protein FJ146_12690 [Deltaproteobacteria bacterium]|nr:hypothetical protein [Deltaproteobacteria bacterium]